MQKLIDNISAQVESFIEQRRNLTMLLACTDNEAGMVMKIIEDIERVSPSDAYFFSQTILSIRNNMSMT